MRGEARAVFATRGDLPSDADNAPLTGHLIAPEVVVVFRGIRIGHQHRDVTSHDLLRGISEDALGGRIEELDGAPTVDENDGIDSRLDDRAPALFAPPKCLLRASLRGQVPRHHDRARGPTGGAA